MRKRQVYALRSFVGWWLAGSRHIHIRGLFLVCTAALIARTGVSCAVCVGARERAVSDYSRKFLYNKTN
jgi:hypothetical protein